MEFEAPKPVEETKEGRSERRLRCLEFAARKADVDEGTIKMRMKMRMLTRVWMILTRFSGTRAEFLWRQS